MPAHGGYRRLRGFIVAQIVYDLTVIFVNQYIDKRSRTCDQMIQAARSGVQNIAEGSQASATSKKTEIKLTNVARASLEELLLDYEDFLRQRGLCKWDKDDTRCCQIRDLRANNLEELRQLAIKMMPNSSDTRARSEIAANCAIVMIQQATYLLNRQLSRLEANFLQNGGFTERLYRDRRAYREKS